MENRYHNGRIYKIVCGDRTYIGSTCQPLSKRMAEHRNTYKRWKNGKTNFVTSFSLFEIGEPTIVLIEAIKCENKEELLKRERHFIETSENVNKTIPGRTKKQYCVDNAEAIKEKGKEYYVDNKEKLKQYYEQNAEAIKEYKKQYYEQNAEAIKEKSKQYREQNAEAIKEYMKQYYVQNAEVIKENKKQYYEQKRN